MRKLIIFLILILFPLLLWAQPSTTSIIAVSSDSATVYTNHIAFSGATVSPSGHKALVTITPGATYEFGANNFNGTGNFTTTGIGVFGSAGNSTFAENVEVGGYITEDTDYSW